MNIRCLTLAWETYSDSSAKTSIDGRRKKLHFVELTRIERNCISRVKTVTRSKLLIEWQRSLQMAATLRKEKNEWQSGSVTTESASREKGQKAKGRGLSSSD